MGHGTGVCSRHRAAGLEERAASIFGHSDSAKLRESLTPWEEAGPGLRTARCIPKVLEQREHLAAMARQLPKSTRFGFAMWVEHAAN